MSESIESISIPFSKSSKLKSSFELSLRLKIVKSGFNVRVARTGSIPKFSLQWTTKNCYEKVIAIKSEKNCGKNFGMLVNWVEWQYADKKKRLVEKVAQKSLSYVHVLLDRKDSPKFFLFFYFFFHRFKLLSDNLRETKAYHGIHLAPLTPSERNCIDQLGCPCH